MSEMRAFHNRLRRLLNIDMRQLVAAGVISSDDTNRWQSFCNDPYRFFIRADDETAEKLWAIIEAPR